MNGYVDTNITNHLQIETGLQSKTSYAYVGSFASNNFRPKVDENMKNKSSVSTAAPTDRKTDTIPINWLKAGPLYVLSARV